MERKRGCCTKKDEERVEKGMGRKGRKEERG